MDIRLQEIVDEAQVKFGLASYELESHSIYKQRNHTGQATYMFTMEWFPKELTEPIDEDYNPDGTAIIEYDLGRQVFCHVSFVQGISFSTITHFPTRQVEEVTAWIEEETGLSSETDFTLTGAHAFGYQYESYIAGFSISPGCTIEVEIDELGKLVAYHHYGQIPLGKMVEKSSYSLTLEEIEPLVKSQLCLESYPSETDKTFVSLFAMKSIFVTMDGTRTIAVAEHERMGVEVNKVMEWLEPLEGEINREEITFLCEVTAAEAFGNLSSKEKLIVTDDQVEQIKVVVRDVMRTAFSTESGKWRLESLQPQENFIEAHCKMIDDEATVFSRKVVVFIDPENMTVLNYIDNGAMFDVFDSFKPAAEAVVTHEEAFEKLLPSISLDPTYVYDIVAGKYILCGLLDAKEAVDAITGDVFPI